MFVFLLLGLSPRSKHLLNVIQVKSRIYVTQSWLNLWPLNFENKLKASLKSVMIFSQIPTSRIRSHLYIPRVLPLYMYIYIKQKVLKEICNTWK